MIKHFDFIQLRLLLIMAKFYCLFVTIAISIVKP